MLFLAYLELLLNPYSSKNSFAGGSLILCGLLFYVPCKTMELQQIGTICIVNNSCKQYDILCGAYGDSIYSNTHKIIALWALSLSQKKLLVEGIPLEIYEVSNKYLTKRKQYGLSDYALYYDMGEYPNRKQYAHVSLVQRIPHIQTLQEITNSFCSCKNILLKITVEDESAYPNVELIINPRNRR